MTYARKTAEQATAKFGLGTGGNARCAVLVEEVIAEVIERCAKEARQPVDQHGAHGLAGEVERRVLALSTETPTGGTKR